MHDRWYSKNINSWCDKLLIFIIIALDWSQSHLWPFGGMAPKSCLQYPNGIFDNCTVNLKLIF